MPNQQWFLFKTSQRWGRSLRYQPTDWWSPDMTKKLLTKSYPHKQIRTFYLEIRRILSIGKLHF